MKDKIINIFLFLAIINITISVVYGLLENDLGFKIFGVLAGISTVGIMFAGFFIIDD